MIRLPDGSEIREDLQLACDWIELSVWSEKEPVSSALVLDRLVEEYIVEGSEEELTSKTNEEAQALVDGFWVELERRAGEFGEAYPFEVEEGSLALRSQRNDFESAYAYFLVLSLARHCPGWSRENESYIEQGSLFELIVEAAFSRIFPSWQCWRSGWGADNPVGWKNVVDEVCRLLKAERGNDYEIWDTPGAKERGLDILLFREFSDNRPSAPCFLVQCGSGKHWPKKLHEPELNVWKSAVNFFCEPNKAFCCPYTLQGSEFRRTAVRVQPGFIVDRERLLQPFQSDASLGEATSERLTAWLRDKAPIVCRE